MDTLPRGLVPPLLDRIPIPWVFVLTSSLLLLAVEFGYRAGRKRISADPERSPASDVDIFLGAVFGLLGLLLAFTFGIAEERFASRKALVLEEANAIGTAYLRAAAVPGEHSQKLRLLLREYADLRGRSLTPDSVAGAIARSQELHTEFWRQARSIALAAPDSEAMSLLLESVNAVIDVHEARVATVLYQRLSPSLFASLIALCVLSMLGLGYRGGLSHARSTFSAVSLAVALSIVFVLIVDLERPWQGLFDVSQRALEDVRKATRQEF